MTRAEIVAAATNEMARWGLVADGWTFKLDNAKRRFGICRYWNQTIGISWALAEINSDEQIMDTILHEIAHALAGPDTGHGPEWVAQCHRVGAKPTVCYDPKEVNTPEGRYCVIYRKLGGGFGYRFAHRFTKKMRRQVHFETIQVYDRKTNTIYLAKGADYWPHRKETP